MLNWSEGYHDAKRFKCGYCNNFVAVTNYFSSDPDRGNNTADLIICPKCNKPTYFDWDHTQFPGPSHGDDIQHLPKDVEDLYNESRNCLKVNAYTSSVLSCRKLLMNIAVSKGAKEGLKFIEYVDFLDSKNYIPPDGKDWVDHIRKKGNEATHQISLKTKKDATDLIDFTEMLLKFIFEFPSRLKVKK